MLKAVVFASLCAVSSIAMAVGSNSVSWTADAVCMLRAIASENPDPKLRNPDSLAAQLCPRPDDFRDYASARERIDVFPEFYAGYFYVNARTKYIDSVLRHAAESGIEQVVILGAGFDSRAYRLHDNYPTLRFFEVDLPAMTAVKKQRLRDARIKIPGQVTLASIDFETQALEDVLPAAGYIAAKKSLFILEGVSMYISEASTGTSLEFVHRHAASGSSIVYDYVLRDILSESRSRYYGMEFNAETAAFHGEPYVTGWMPAEAAGFVRSHGLNVIEDLGPDALAERFLIGSTGKPDGKPLEGFRIMQASVP
jgi:methyltransferase (TIGR00027 family)